MPPESARRLLREASLELARLRRVRGASHKTWRRIARAQARLAFAAALLAAAPIAEPAAAVDPLFRHGLVFDGSRLGLAYEKYPAFADIDGDGDLDVFVCENYLWFFENTGTATLPAFAAPTTSPFGLSTVPFGHVLELADLDGDGDLDGLVKIYGGVLFLANTGTASAPAFAAPVTNPFGLGQANAGFFTFADVDADGDLDVFTGTAAGVTLLFNTGTASAPAFAPPTTNPFGLGPVGDHPMPTFADVDGDGDLDLFVGAFPAEIAFFANTGTATAPAFAPAQSNPFGLAHEGAYVDLAFADVEGDGDLDALVGGFYANLLIFENTGTASSPAFDAAGNPVGLDVHLLASHNSPGDRGPYASPVFGDLDGDGDLDALIGDYAGRSRHSENTGTLLAPAFAAPSTSPFGLADVGSNATPVLADIDGDGDLDAFIGNRAGNTVFFANSGTTTNPAFAAPSTNPFGLADVGTYAAPELADIDGDGDLDAFVGNSIVNTLFFANTGTTTTPAFALPSTNPFGLAQGSTRSPSLADVDADGDLDLFADADGRTNFFRNTGTASAPAFAAPQLDPFGFVDVGALINHAFADLDGDGDLDGFVGNYNGRIVLFENVLVDEDACSDGLDNDGDGRTDLGSDAGCANAADTSELSSLQCDNGLDDDADGKIDWRGDGSGDPHCSGLLDNRELPSPPPGPGCGIGPELLLLGPLLAAIRRRKPLV